ncbi:MAG: hypothetical protein DSY43_00895 [Gammaproteobacteria bacterium]|nr:MAG: hypothetical protein DSY43_00895 [Gammaproteobacteria bacterium]
MKEQHKTKRNAEKREQYWRDRFMEQTVAMEKDDDHDLTTILNGVEPKNVPENMQCLLEQQRKILKTTSRNGYRWHPK